MRGPLRTFIKARKTTTVRDPILIGGFPGAGSVGQIALAYLRQQLKAKPLADLFSPHFPSHVVVNSRGQVRLPRARFYLWQDPQVGGHDLILVTGDSQAQGLEGQYEVTDAILSFAHQRGVNTVITLGGFRSKGNASAPQAVALSANRALLEKMRAAGAKRSPEGLSVAGFTGLALRLAGFRKMTAACVLGETVGYLPDPKAAKAVLSVLRGFLGIALDFSSLDKAIDRAEDVFGRMEDVQQAMEALATERAEIEGRQITYIS